jgi:hypothetical protein
LQLEAAREAVPHVNRDRRAGAKPRLELAQTGPVGIGAALVMVDHGRLDRIAVALAPRLDLRVLRLDREARLARLVRPRQRLPQVGQQRLLVDERRWSFLAHGWRLWRLQNTNIRSNF